MENSSDEELELHAPLTRHGPVVRANPEDLALQREYWNMCAIVFLLDYKKFSIRHLQHLINSAWKIRGNVMVVGRESYNYILHFDVLDDLTYICEEGPWAVEGALLVLERWRPNLVIKGLQLNFVSLWIQLHGLPLEYQYPELSMQMGHIIGLFERIDWDANLPRNASCVSEYERLHKLCTKCGLIGHIKAQCTYLMEDVILHRQRQRIQNQFHVQYGYDPMEPHYINEIKAFYNIPQRRNTQVRFGPLARDTGYRQRQFQHPNHKQPYKPETI
uniref:DUF4283 domain-containing protein n=1 Tax=Fagus sylvatica TaxID=28930 RepID=A0A2N9E636_FAGSY